MKIDVEGFEEPIFRNAEGELRRLPEGYPCQG